MPGLQAKLPFPACLAWLNRAWENPNQPPRGATGTHHLLCVLDEQPCVHAAHERWVWSCRRSCDGSASGSLLPSVRAMTTGWEQHQYGITVLNYSYFSGDYVFHGKNYQDLGNARQNQLEKHESFCWHSHTTILMFKKFFPLIHKKRQLVQKKHNFSPKRSILDLLLFLREAGLPPNSYARG